MELVEAELGRDLGRMDAVFLQPALIEDCTSRIKSIRNGKQVSTTSASFANS